MTTRFSPSWTMVFYSAPRDTRKAISAERKFRKAMVKGAFGAGSANQASNGRGFTLVLGSPQRVRAALLPLLPLDGELRTIGVTDAQYGQMSVNLGAMRKAPALV